MAALLSPQPMREPILELLKANPGKVFDAVEVCNSLITGGLRTTRNVLALLAKRGLIERRELGKYVAHLTGPVPVPAQTPASPNGRRIRSGKRASTFSETRTTKRELKALRRANVGVVRCLPATRGDCLVMDRPCPFVSCRYHLHLDVDPKSGGLKILRPDIDVWELKETCVLDVASRGELTLEQVGVIMNITRERVRQIERDALQKLKKYCKRNHIELKDMVQEIKEAVGHRNKTYIPSSYLPPPSPLCKQISQKRVPPSSPPPPLVFSLPPSLEPHRERLKTVDTPKSRRRRRCAETNTRNAEIEAIVSAPQGREKAPSDHEVAILTPSSKPVNQEAKPQEEDAVIEILKKVPTISDTQEPQIWELLAQLDEIEKKRVLLSRNKANVLASIEQHPECSKLLMMLGERNEENSKRPNPSTRRGALLSLIEENPELNFDATTASDKLGIPASKSVGTELGRLFRRGLIRRISMGVYTAKGTG